MAAVGGIRNPCILLPIQALQWPAERFQIAVRHELLHVKRNDLLTQAVAGFATIVYWFNPLVWAAARLLRREREEAVDDRMLAYVQPSIYAKNLLMACAESGVKGAVAMSHRSNLERRIYDVLDLRKNRDGLKKNTLALGGAVLAVALIVLAMCGPVSAGDAGVPAGYPFTETHRLTSCFGSRLDPITGKSAFHSGCDFAMPVGTPVLATADGEVVFAGWDPRDENGYGYYITIAHDQDYLTLYAKLSEVKVNPGDEVQRGDVIGLSGNTGLSTGPHLHYEIRLHGEPIDPQPLMEGKDTAGD